MSEFFKTLLKGVIYVLLLPVIVAFLALVFIYCVGVFLYMAIRNLIIFFAGGNPGGDLKEDVEAKRRLAERFNPVEKEVEETIPADQPELVRPLDLQAESEEATLPVQEEQQSEEGGIDDGDSSETYGI